MPPRLLLWLSFLAVAFGCTLMHADEPSPFIIGADISWVQQQEAKGRRWTDEVAESSAAHSNAIDPGIFE
jgi:hypothetical protein